MLVYQRVTFFKLSFFWWFEDCTRWWFQRSFIFTLTWGNDPIWRLRIFFNWLGSNQPPNRPTFSFWNEKHRWFMDVSGWSCHDFRAVLQNYKWNWCSSCGAWKFDVESNSTGMSNSDFSLGKFFYAHFKNNPSNSRGFRETSWKTVVHVSYSKTRAPGKNSASSWPFFGDDKKFKRDPLKNGWLGWLGWLG